jgi:hypothetical protein
MASPLIVLDCAIVAVTEGVPRLLTVPRDGLDALPSGPLDLEGDRTLERGLRRWVREQTGLDALVRQVRAAGSDDAQWRDWYGYFPWEDWRGGRPRVLDETIVPALTGWIEEGDRTARRERAEITFGLEHGAWDGVRVLERYELLWEARLVPESGGPPGLGRPMAMDHRRIAATALGRLRGKLTYRPVVFELLPPAFTLLQLQNVVEALSGVRLHKQNFRRLVERGGLVEGLGEVAATRGRPAELFRFRREVLGERPAPGVGMPGRRAADAS